MAVPTVSVEEKLKKFQLVCESKLRKTEILEKQHVKNDEILRGFQKDYLVQSEIAQLNLDLAQAQFDLVKHKEKRAKEEERHKVLQDETTQFQLELEEAVESVNHMIYDIDYVKRRMQQRNSTLTECVTTRRENYLMTLEDNRTLSALILDATKRTQTDQRIDWLQKLIDATRIQHNEAERRLTELRSQKAAASTRPHY